MNIFTSVHGRISNKYYKLSGGYLLLIPPRPGTAARPEPAAAGTVAVPGEDILPGEGTAPGAGPQPGVGDTHGGHPGVLLVVEGNPVGAGSQETVRILVGAAAFFREKPSASFARENRSTTAPNS